ncbi:hypothetical protein J6590_027953 [Homalodisca vitripennis]|nr:hypothetical protein J6590_027953 [Homalodisca vitripennis]
MSDPWSADRSAPHRRPSSAYDDKLRWRQSRSRPPSHLFPRASASKMGLGPTHPGTGLPFFCHNGDHLTQPPPAHMGIPPYQLDPKGAVIRMLLISGKVDKDCRLTGRLRPPLAARTRLVTGRPCSDERGPTSPPPPVPSPHTP